VRNYVPKDDGLEPTDFDEYHDIPAQTAKDLAARVYLKIERDPGRAARLDKRQNEAVMEALKWGTPTGRNCGHRDTRFLSPGRNDLPSC
jgi:hypothetical protein